ncbi:tetratricopeptide repeat protein [Tautonia sociabilis]|uniref:Uncharacterized protein n=1 Tax=Tautonia sociabilis TaxID=2080755 RepID=A0A432MHP5_9BACT|nr:hypothetical protein [Tautonia sociabilis]RUL86868.1 hypothetical protein TsocGM_15400 [Tautonia sociabilis]
MRRRHPRWPGPIGLAMVLGAITLGCGGSDRDRLPIVPPPRGGADSPAGAADSGGGSDRNPLRGMAMDPAMREALLRNVVSLLERAPMTPGGQNIDIATANLNQYFRSTPDAEFLLTDAARSYLTEQLADSPFQVKEFEDRQFGLKDARHIEDCLLYHNIAARVAGGGTTLDRVRRLFDWTVRHVQLVPPEGPYPDVLIEQGIKPVPTRPYDVLVRGFASEIPGDAWAERSWVFLALCRQIGVDAAMIGYDVEGRETPYYWLCAALVDGTPYLFDTRIGLEIPSPDGQGVATLEQAANDPSLLDGLDLASPPIPYETEAADLGTIRVFLDSSRGYFAPKMRLLQNDLAGANRMVLHRDPTEQRDAWTAALGDRLASVELWELPLTVEFRLFTDGAYVQAIQYVNYYFDPQFPLLGPRLRQLRGDLAEAKQEFTRARFRRDLSEASAPQLAPQVRQEIHESIDLYATYFLALTQLDDEMPDQAINLFEQALRLPPQDTILVKGRPATLLRLGAETNLGMLYEAKGDVRRAVSHYAASNTTPQSQGNLLRANALVFADPFGPAPPEPGPGAGSPAEEPPSDAEADPSVSPNDGSSGPDAAAEPDPSPAAP